MPEYDNTNRGVLFKNDKGDNPKRPDYTGNLDVGGREYELAAWIQESKKGLKYMALKVQLPEGESDIPVPAATTGASNAGSDDEIPF